MSVFDTFSKRKARLENKDKPDVYTYAELPIKLKRQIIHIWISAIGIYWIPRTIIAAQNRVANNNTAWNFIHQRLCRELGVFALTETSHLNAFEHCQEYLQNSDVDESLDLIEISFRYIYERLRSLRPYDRDHLGISQTADEAIEELNQRFRESSVGYQFINGEIIRIDSQLIHDQVVKPAISLLHSEKFKGAEAEFLKAHEHYRHARYKESLNEALKAFESTLKTICKQKGWSHPANATASPLIDVVISNGLIPKELASHFTGIRTTLESGIPTIRNKNAGHGQGAEPVDVPDYLVAYGLHVAAAGIVFLVEASKMR